MTGLVSGEYVHLVYNALNEFHFPDPNFRFDYSDDLSPREWYDWTKFCTRLDKLQLLLRDIQVRDCGARIMQKSINHYKNLGYDEPVAVIEDLSTLIPTKNVPTRELPHNALKSSTDISFDTYSGLPPLMLEGMVRRIFKSYNIRVIHGRISQIAENEEGFRISIRYQKSD